MNIQVATFIIRAWLSGTHHDGEFGKANCM